MSGAALGDPVALSFGAGLLAGAAAVNVVASPALIALAASLLTAAALAPIVSGGGDWAGRLAVRASEALGRRWPRLGVRSDRDARQRVFAFLAALNLAVLTSFFLRGGG
jgi:hypothetical protein